MTEVVGTAATTAGDVARTEVKIHGDVWVWSAWQQSQAAVERSLEQAHVLVGEAAGLIPVELGVHIGIAGAGKPSGTVTGSQPNHRKYTFCQHLFPEEGHNGGRCTCWDI
ncbi:hypothetical protein F5888DRAFT_1636312 [Russula emetica]|nr:hypothetical protein F5888DRAFT_1636312 [Russula emetica]